MSAGIPGIGLAGLFYILCAVAMPFIELVHTVRGRSSLARWAIVTRQLGLAGVMVGGIALSVRVVLLLLPASAPVSGQPSTIAAGAVRALPFDGSAAFLVTMGVLLGLLLLVEIGRLAVAAAPRRQRPSAVGETEHAAPAAAGQGA